MGGFPMTFNTTVSLSSWITLLWYLNKNSKKGSVHFFCKGHPVGCNSCTQQWSRLGSGLTSCLLSKSIDFNSLILFYFLHWISMLEKALHKSDQNLPCYTRYIDRNTIFSKYISICLELPRQWSNGSWSCIFKISCEAWSF